MKGKNNIRKTNMSLYS